MRIAILASCLILFITAPAQKNLVGRFPQTKFEFTDGRETVTYQEAIDWWKKMDAASGQVKMLTMGATDAGLPLHLVLVSKDGDFDLQSMKRKQKTVILILNGIHPGEPDGIDASMLLVRSLVLRTPGKTAKDSTLFLPGNVVLAIVPVYNIGGALNRSTDYRVDQNGPQAFGFRGNSQNLDLNRDFIKCDSKEALSFTKLFHLLDPDIFIDNHVSNGADYQHVMTLLSTQHNKLGGELGNYLHTKLEPAIYDSMRRSGWDLVPYVNHFGETPEKGWSEFWDSPRYSSGYATLWNCFSFVPETHMLKPYPQGVAATRDLMFSFIRFAATNGSTIVKLRMDAKNKAMAQDVFPIAWKWDSSKFVAIPFKGYEAGHKPSLVSGQPRLFYDRGRPFSREIRFYNEYFDTLSVSRPKAYLIPQGWWKVIERLQANGVRMQQLRHDTTIAVEWYRIASFQSSSRPYEGHHLNTNVQVERNKGSLSFSQGDWLVPVTGDAVRFLIETLEPQAEDSYFAWNFFDPILGAKEGFSDYVFEETAAGYLAAHPELRAQLTEKARTDSAFSVNGRAQLNYVFQHSPYYEPAHLRYPVYRILN